MDTGLAGSRLAAWSSRPSIPYLFRVQSQFDDNFFILEEFPGDVSVGGNLQMYSR
jgi:hypothetical protein